MRVHDFEHNIQCYRYYNLNRGMCTLLLELDLEGTVNIILFNRF
jgi:hypothetical protein